MKQSTWITKIPIWAPAVFCAVLSAMKMFAPDDAGDPAFYSFLPACFFFVAIIQSSLWRRIEVLETALRESTDQEAGTAGN